MPYESTHTGMTNDLSGRAGTGGSVLDGFPEEARTRHLAELRAREEHDARYKQRQRQQHLLAAAMGGVIYLVLTPLMVKAGPLFFLVLGIIGMMAGFVLSVKEADHLQGILIFGGTAITATLIGYFFGGVALKFLQAFFVWLFYLVAGGCLGVWIQGRE
ncbi:MAG: hypothetical protein AB1486_05725 [Planctomycetota bacterium]